MVMEGIVTDNTLDYYAPIIDQFKNDRTVYRFSIDLPEDEIRPISKPKVRRDGAGLQKVLTWNSRPLGASLGRKRTFRDLFKMTAQTNLAKLFKKWQGEVDYLITNNHGVETLLFRKWIQDPFLVLEWNGATIFLNSMRQQQLCDFFLPLELSSQIHRKKKRLFFQRPSLLYLEGGNILIGKDKAFVGKDLLAQNIEIRKEHEEDLDQSEVETELKEELGVSEIVWVQMEKPHRRLKANGGNSKSGTTEQPFYHIDLFMTLGGKLSEGKDLIFLAKPVVRETSPSAQRYSEADPELQNARAQIEEVKHCFPSDQYKIVEVPLLIRDDVAYTWNNALVEVYRGIKRVYLPSYQSKARREGGLNPIFKELEVEVQSIYESEGFEVVWMKNGEFFRILAQAGGSLHCITKVIRREHP